MQTTWTDSTASQPEHMVLYALESLFWLMAGAFDGSGRKLDETTALGMT